MDSALLGVVEGLTEFLPVSSTGHLTVAEKLLGKQVDNPAVTAFTAIIQFGAIVATLIYFRRDVVRLVAAWGRGLVSAPARRNPDYRFAWYVIAGSLPVAVVGLLAKDLVKGPLRNLWVVAAALLLWSGVMYVAEGRGRQKYGEDELTRVPPSDGARAVRRPRARHLTVGRDDLRRPAARLHPGHRHPDVVLPRHPGADRRRAVRAQGCRHLVVGWGPLAVGTLVSFVVAYAAIAWLLRFVAHHPITVFVWYRVAAGVLLALLLAADVISPT